MSDRIEYPPVWPAHRNRRKTFGPAAWPWLVACTLLAVRPAWAADGPLGWFGAAPKPVACDEWLPDGQGTHPTDTSLAAAADAAAAEGEANDDTAAKSPGMGQGAEQSGGDNKTARAGAEGKAKKGEQGEKGEQDKEEEEEKSFYVAPRSYGTLPETDPPKYVRNLSEIEFFERPKFDQLDKEWLDLGLDYRMRYEFRDDDFRRPVAVTDEPFLLRTRAYLGVKEVLDPFRFAIEFEDAGIENSQFPDTPRDVNHNEIIQAFGELHFDHVPGLERQVRVQAGRLAFEAVDRRLIARNEWRNTTNNFQGLRALIGEQSDDWQLDLLALNPMILTPYQLDQADDRTGFYGAIGDWRRWSELVTLQPYYLVLDRHPDRLRHAREIHTLAMRGYGVFEESGWDYDSDVAFQFGRDGDESHRAFAFTSEIGYSWSTPSKPRLGAFLGYASGDRDPNDDVSQRFDRLFGFGRPWSADDYFLWSNVIAPKTRLEFQPHEKLRIDIGYGTYWLASATDAWFAANLRDPTGQSGTFLGQEIDVRFRVAATKRTQVTVGYAHFMPGGFTQRVGRSNDSDFFYVETLTNLFQ